MRYALYFAPAAETVLAATAAEWLGRDAYTGEALAQPEVDGLSASRLFELTADARRYGFHGTLKAPFSLAEGHSADELADSVEAFARRRRPFPLQLIVARLSGFLALVPAAPSAELDKLAADCVVDFDRFRAPLSDDALAKRRAGGLTPRQDALLSTYGYPYVLDEFRFHLTLSERIHGQEGDALEAAARDFFSVAIADPIEVSSVAVFFEPTAGAPFMVASQHNFTPV